MTDFEELKKLYDEMDVLSNKDMDDEKFGTGLLAWIAKATRFLQNKYGENSHEYRGFLIMVASFSENSENKSKSDYRQSLQGNMFTIIKEMWKPLLDELKEEQTMENQSNVFVVHGHNDELKYKICYFLKKIKLNPIILHEQTNSSRTIIEKIEKHGREASAAIVLFTPDDLGNAKTEEERKARARQNVVFEAGYFMGLLGRDKTILIVSDKSIELPGDLSGVVYSEDSELSIARELKTMGLSVDVNGLLSI